VNDAPVPRRRDESTASLSKSDGGMLLLPIRGNEITKWLALGAYASEAMTGSDFSVSSVGGTVLDLGCDVSGRFELMAILPYYPSCLSV
jgi:hypothetical protein